MVSVFDFIKFEMQSLSHMTELLESCGWDESVMQNKINTFEDVLQVLPIEDIKEKGFDKWVQSTLIPVLVLNGISENQATILAKVIFNSRDDLLRHMNLGEN